MITIRANPKDRQAFRRLAFKIILAVGIPTGGYHEIGLTLARLDFTEIDDSGAKPSQVTVDCIAIQPGQPGDLLGVQLQAEAHDNFAEFGL